MLRRNLYYLMKPYTPWGVRMLARRIVAKRQWKRHSARWPIDTKANEPPPKWPGWPDRKRFAFVLTHDVEGAIGINRIKDLAEREIEAGFRSSFNFIPEGTYEVSADLRHWLGRSGFEVGVHDLRHDGRLFDSEQAFRLHSERINYYIRNWRAVGFRGGFMMRNLDWLHELDISYDASTFDTDPFEWQSDGARTIFPFIIPPCGKEPTKRGYVELPYTLSQDSTLFMLLQQPGIEIWRRKLDWIAEHGGMALLNVHPDYLHFRPTRANAATIGQLYFEFLRYVVESYGGTYWQPLPREVASFVRHSNAPHLPTLLHDPPSA